MPMSQGQNTFTQALVAIRPWLVAQRASAHADYLKRSALTQAASRHVAHQLSTGGCAHHFFRNASRVTSISSIDSASIFFSRVFSLSSSFRRLASDTLIPPNLLRQR